MPTRQFTFFAVMVGFSLIGNAIPLISGAIDGLILPLVILVSGWRYGAYLVLFDFAMGIPDMIRSSPLLGVSLQLVQFTSQSQNMTQAEFHQYLVSAVPQVALVPAIAPWESNIIAIGGALFMVLMLWFMCKSLMRYIKTLRLVHRIVRGWHR